MLLSYRTIASNSTVSRREPRLLITFVVFLFFYSLSATPGVRLALSGHRGYQSTCWISSYRSLPFRLWPGRWIWGEGDPDGATSSGDDCSLCVCVTYRCVRAVHERPAQKFVFACHILLLLSKGDRKDGNGSAAKLRDSIAVFSSTITKHRSQHHDRTCCFPASPASSPRLLFFQYQSYTSLYLHSCTLMDSDVKPLSHCCEVRVHARSFIVSRNDDGCCCCQ